MTGWQSNRQRPHVKKHAPLEGTPRSIYNGEERCGPIAPRGLEWVAYNRQHQPIGVYDTAAEAVAAVMRRTGGAS
jgi:hypothetical protein